MLTQVHDACTVREHWTDTTGLTSRPYVSHYGRHHEVRSARKGTNADRGDFPMDGTAAPMMRSGLSGVGGRPARSTPVVRVEDCELFV